MWQRFYFPSSTLVFVGVVACSDGVGPSGITLQPRISLEPIFELDSLPGQLQGLALSPDGGNIVLASRLGSKIFVLDAGTFDLVSSAPVSSPWGVRFDPAGDRVFVAGRQGVFAYEVPYATPAWETPVPFTVKTIILATPDGSAYVASGVQGPYRHAPSGVARFGREGDLQVFRRIPEGISSAALATVAGTILLGDDVGVLHLLDPATLVTTKSVATGNRPCVIVPLGGTRAALVGGLQVLIVDYELAIVESRSSLERDPRFHYAEYGYGNPWVAIDDRTAIVGGLHGLVILDIPSGRVKQQISSIRTLDDVSICCEVAFDPLRDRLLVASTDGSGYGRFVAYRIHHEAF
jgi:hypothetical protein